MIGTVTTPTVSTREKITGTESTMTDNLRKRWEDLNREAYGQSTPLLEKLFDFTREVMERLEITQKATGLCADSPWKDTAKIAQKALDCEGPELGGKGKVDIREWFARKP